MLRCNAECTRGKKNQQKTIFEGSFVIILVHSLTSGSQTTEDGGHRVNMSLKSVLSKKKNRSTPLIPYTENKNKLKNTYYYSIFSFLLLQSSSICRRIWQCTGRYYRRHQNMSCKELQQQNPKFSVKSLLEVPLSEMTTTPSKLNRNTSWLWLYQLAASAFSATGSAGPSWGRCHQRVHWRVRIRVQEIYLQHTFYSSH